MSSTNLVDLATGDFLAMENPESERAITAPRDHDHSVSSDPPSDDVITKRLIVVSNHLPIKATRRYNQNGGFVWDFVWDEDSIYIHIQDGLPTTMKVFYVGLLRVDVDPNEQDEVAATLLDRFNCVAVFVRPEVLSRYYHGFCKQYLWPIFHYMLPFSDIHGSRFDRDLWNAYVSVNNKFSLKVIDVVNTDDDYVWIHDYHLMVLPTFLRRRFNQSKIGLFVHSPFPSSEVYKTIPVRTEILNGLLNADLIGFHTFDYARHFLSCCSRVFGLEYQLKRGYISLDCNGRSVGIKIMPSGINVSRMESLLMQHDTRLIVRELKRRFERKTVLLGVDDLDMFKGVNLKILAMEEMLKSNPQWLGSCVLVQILNPARGRIQDVAGTNAEIRASCDRINNELGNPAYQPIVLIDGPLSSSEKAAYYAVSEVVIVTPVRDGMNLIPYEYVVCRQGASDENDPNCRFPKKSMVVVSEFIGCSPSLSGAIRVNPWDVGAMAEAMDRATSASDARKETYHMKHYDYIRNHDIANWARSFVQDLERTCIDHSQKIWVKLGLSLDFRVIFFDHKFRKLRAETLENSYRRAQNRAILLDYDGTIMPSINTRPTDDVISVINKLCDDPKNTVFIVSGRGKENLGEWFGPCEKLGIAAEHGVFIRWAADEEWELCESRNNVGWMNIAESIMNIYTETTDGSYVERKESAVVWHHEDADPDFGSVQAKELLNHLETMLAKEPVTVKRGHFILEAKPQGVSKGIVAKKIFASMAEKGRQADFVLSIGNDRSDEDMFVAIGEAIEKGEITNNESVFSCIVGQKPSEAEYYVEETSEVETLLGIISSI